MIFFQNKTTRILKKHEKLNFPQFSKADQLKMILYDDFSKIRNLTKDKLLPAEVLDHYIHLSEQEVFEHILIAHLLTQYNVQKINENFGMVITNTSAPFKVILKDQWGYLERGWEFDEMGLKDFFSKLLLSKVPKYSYLNPIT